MAMEDKLIISIWRSDPVGGVFIDWPQDTTDGYLESAAELKNLLVSDAVRQRNWKTLLRVGNDLPDVWVPHDQIVRLEHEIQSLLHAEEARVSEMQIEMLSRLLSACRFATGERDAGIYIG
jgi:hypothetical protein